MTVKELWEVAPLSHVFIVIRSKTLCMNCKEEYKGGSYYADMEVDRVTARLYPNYGPVLEVKMKGENNE